MNFRGKILQYYVFIAGSFTVLLSGLHLGWPSPSLPQLLSSNSTIPMTNNEGSWVASFFLIGIAIGSVLSGLTLDILGRRKMLLMASLPFSGTWLMIAFATTIWELCVARFIAGVLESLTFCCIPVYLAEICDSNVRGLFVSGFMLVFLFGVFLINLLGAFFNITSVALICTVLSLVSLTLVVFVPESPYFYMLKDDIKNARKAMEKFNTNNDVDACLNAIQISIKEQKNGKNKLLQLFLDATNRKTLFTVLTLTAFQQLSGVTGILFYVQTLFKETQDSVSPIVCVTIYYVLQIVVLIVSIYVIDKVGRRVLLLLSMSLVLVALCLLSIYFSLQHWNQIDAALYHWIPIFGFSLFIVGYTIGLYNIPILLGGEVFPLQTKAYAVSMSDIFFGLFGTIVSKFFQYTKDEFGIYFPFIAFTICCMCGLPFIIFCIPETKGRTLEEIQIQLRTKKIKKNVNS